MNKLKSKAFKIRFFNPHPELQRRQYILIPSLTDNTERPEKTAKENSQQEESELESTTVRAFILFHKYSSTANISHISSKVHPSQFKNLHVGTMYKK